MPQALKEPTKPAMNQFFQNCETKTSKPLLSSLVSFYNNGVCSTQLFLYGARSKPLKTDVPTLLNFSFKIITVIKARVNVNIYLRWAFGDHFPMHVVSCVLHGCVIFQLYPAHFEYSIRILSILVRAHRDWGTLFYTVLATMRLLW